ncbi:hypothetical protein ACJX0J_013512, partial [Zea mays]
IQLLDVREFIRNIRSRSFLSIQLLDVREFIRNIFEVDLFYQIGINILSRLDAVNGPEGIFVTIYCILEDDQAAIWGEAVKI